MWTVSSFELLQIKLKWTFVGKALYKYIPFKNLGKYIGIKQQDHMAGVY